MVLHPSKALKVALFVPLLWAAMGSVRAAAMTMDQCTAPFDAYMVDLNKYYEGDVPEGERTDLLSTGAVNLEWINSFDLDGLKDLAANAKEWEKLAQQPDDDDLGEDAQTLRRLKLAVITCIHKERISELLARLAADDKGGPIDAGHGADLAKEEIADLSRLPVPLGETRDWFAKIEYPSAAMRDRRTGTTRYDVTVNAQGGVEGCQASGPQGSSDLEIATCDAILANAQFDPARNSKGESAVGEYSGSLDWDI